MDTPLDASAATAGTLLSSHTFSIPEFQREYAWTTDEVQEFWDDLRNALEDNNYFLGLVILSGTGIRKEVVDGQQRILTLTLLAIALYHESIAADRRALADRLQATFLRAIDFQTDEERPRLHFSSEQDAATLDMLLTRPSAPTDISSYDRPTLSQFMFQAYNTLVTNLRSDLAPNPFKRLGIWADFITNHIYFANFVHPDPASAYRVFEIVNTRGKELTTADLLKSNILSQTAPHMKEQRYREWQTLARAFPLSSTQFVQFIRHVVTTELGHILPSDLYDVLAGRSRTQGQPMGPDKLMAILSSSLPIYLQMIDPSLPGPATDTQLAVFSALNRLSVVSVRPVLLAIAPTDEADIGMQQLLRLVVRRIVVGNLGTGNVERRLGNAAQIIRSDQHWRNGMGGLDNLNPPAEDFVGQLSRRSLNKNVLAFIRNSILQSTIVPTQDGFLHLVMPRDDVWPSFDEDRASYWASTIGNTILITQERRPHQSSEWEGFKNNMLPLAVGTEWTAEISGYERWDESAVRDLGNKLAVAAAKVWYSEGHKSAHAIQ